MNPKSGKARPSGSDVGKGGNPFHTVPRDTIFCMGKIVVKTRLSSQYGLIQLQISSTYTPALSARNIRHFAVKQGNS